MDTPEEDGSGSGGSGGGSGGGGSGYLAALEHQELSTVFGHLSNLCPLDSTESFLQVGDPGPEKAGPTIGDVKPPWGSMLAEQATVDHSSRQFNLSRDVSQDWHQRSFSSNQELPTGFGYFTSTVEDVKPLRGSTSVEQATEDHHFGRQIALQQFNISPDVYQDWHQGRIFSNQDAHPQHHATRRHLNFDVVMPCHSCTPRSHEFNAGHNHAGCSSGVPPTSLPNSGHSLLSIGGPQEFSSWQQISDARKMPFQFPGDLEKLIQMTNSSKNSFVFSNPTGEVFNLVGDGQYGDGATNTLKNGSSENALKLPDHKRMAEPKSVTPRRRRRKAANAKEDGRCKRCNCRRSKCLKLYCECFAAGVYCMDSCACELCCNNVDFEDMVLESRRQIESRNSLAFGPKVVQQAINSPPDKAEGGGSEATLSSVRHIRGCNCKKSQCLKKYCECFQAKVGCFPECNCEKCCNPFSPKSAEQRTESREILPHGTLDSMQGMPDSIRTGTGGQSTSTREGTVNMLNNTPSPTPLAYSNHPNTRGCSSSSQPERHQGTVPLHLPSSPIDMPPLEGDNASRNLVVVSTMHDMPEGVNISEVGTSSLSNLANASSPNQRQVSTSQSRPPRWSPSISPRSTSLSNLANASSPNQRQVLTSQSRPPRWSPSISPSSRRARKPDWRKRPSPDGKSEGGSRQA